MDLLYNGDIGYRLATFNGMQTIQRNVRINSLSNKKSFKRSFGLVRKLSHDLENKLVINGVRRQSLSHARVGGHNQRVEISKKMHQVG